jgi:glycosidase
MTSSPDRREFHVSKKARDRYGFDRSLFSLTGNVIFVDFRAARDFAHLMNEVRGVAGDPAGAVSAGQINAMGLIDEFSHLMVARYRERTNPGLLTNALNRLELVHGRAAVDELLLRFTSEFPPVSVYAGEIGAAAWLEGRTGSTSHRETALEELLLLWLANRNPAFAPFRELFDDSNLRRTTIYEDGMESFEEHLGDQPRVEGTRSRLLELLTAPFVASPDSLDGQLDYIRSAWAAVLGPELDRVLASLDMLAEEQRLVFPPGPGPVQAPRLGGPLEDEREAYSDDLDWMPNVVLLAKNAYVWLNQLSERYGWDIRTLDAIPDAELDRLSSWGITSLWLIGIWERSRASAEIKQRMGDTEAVASAYSLQDYRIADELGSDAAFDELRSRAWQRGIRMATDMVPNHVGIDSRWVVEHPDWFIGLDHPPFPSYSFSGPDLCHDERVGVYMEDHYWDRSDAAVVFKRVDHWTGEERYIYHGNDGTSMPWNDTAQLNFCRADVREAVIQTILHVARQSPIIRFDAAMTLVKKHFHRLWFPEPGTGGDIPSRAGYGMTRADFDAAMPEEFWREVVDRVAREVPDTLLLAEAFWLLEGYFVRSLGMHRVYNSAFMNMLRDEKNAEYRHLIASTLEYDPRILKRYVNFMSNPDERTAVDQFGRDDKYFGVATMMATLPGLPMFGHGQIEGLAEKYGMEFQRARWDEQPDLDLIARHERQLFPLLRRRWAFAEVDRFRLYDLLRGDGQVDENVFAYSNGSGEGRSLVLFHNVFAESSGWIKTSTPIQASPGDDGSQLTTTELAAALELPAEPNAYVVLRDAATGLEFLRSCAELHERGLYVELKAYSLHVFTSPRVITDSDGRIAELAAALAGRGVADVQQALAELELADVLGPFGRLVSAEILRPVLEPEDSGAADLEVRYERIAEALDETLEAIARRTGEEVRTLDAQSTVEDLRRWSRSAPGQSKVHRAASVAFMLLRRCDVESAAKKVDRPIRSRLDDWHLLPVLSRSLSGMGYETAECSDVAATVRAMFGCDELLDERPDWTADLAGFVKGLLADPEIASYLGVNRSQGVDWFVSEPWDELLGWLPAVLQIRSAVTELPKEETAALKRLEKAKEPSEFQVKKLLSVLSTT